MTIPITWLVVHFVADFVLQSDWMAQNKSKRWDALGLHCIVYATCWAVFGFFSFRAAGGWFALITYITHFATDAVTSRINSRLWQAKQVHWFFVGIGADQVIHYATLAATGYWLGILR